MTPETIKSKEDEFFRDLISTEEVKYRLIATKDIGNGVKIYSIRPDYDTYYFKSFHGEEPPKKQKICLHFTVGYIKSDVASLSSKKSKDGKHHISVPYVVDRSGRIYELFPDEYWSYHLGAHAVGGNEAMSSQSIGIEISNFGPLIHKDNDGVLRDDLQSHDWYCDFSEKQYYDEYSYRGCQYFASMTGVQIDAVATLIKYLVNKHKIPMNFKSNDALFASDAEAVAFRGIFYHTSVRRDKWDWPFTPSLKAVIARCMDKLI